MSVRGRGRRRGRGRGRGRVGVGVGVGVGVHPLEQPYEEEGRRQIAGRRAELEV